MYARLSIVAEGAARARADAMRDRDAYRKFMSAAEEFAVENDLIVGGDGATRLLLGDPDDTSQPPRIDLDSFRYDFYSGQPLRASRALAERLYRLDPEGLGHYTTMITKIPDNLFSIEVNGRSMFTVTALPAYRGIKIADVVIPSYRPAQFRTEQLSQIACMGPEIQLMELYAALCNPARSADWEKLLDTETRLRGLFQGEIRKKFEIAIKAPQVGGGRKMLTGLYRDIYEKFAAGSSRVLIGPAAIQLLSGSDDYAALLDLRLQLVTVEPLESEAKELASLARARGVELQWAMHDPKIPTDMRIRRLTVSITSETGRREPILDIYNAAGHELVPFCTLAVTNKRGKPSWRPPASLKIGTPFVLMRFRLADMWTMQVLLRMKTITAAYALNVLNDMLDDYVAAARSYEDLLSRAPVDLAAVLPMVLPESAYIGRLEAPELALKRATLKQRGGRFHPPFLPASTARD